MCYQYFLKGMNQSSSSYRSDLNGHSNFYMIAINKSIITREVMVSVSLSDKHPIMGSAWSPTIALAPRPHWYVVTYRKFSQYTLPHWYSQDGFSDIIYGRCYLKCTDSLLAPHGFVYSGFHTDPSNLRLITYPDMQDVRIKNLYVSIRHTCDRACFIMNDVYQPEYHYLATEISNVGDSSFLQVNGSYAFYLDPSTYPTTTVIYREALLLFQLFTTLGSILSSWFGVSLSIMYTLRQSVGNDGVTAGQQLNLIESELSQITATLQLEQVIHMNKRSARPHK